MQEKSIFVFMFVCIYVCTCMQFQVGWPIMFGVERLCTQQTDTHIETHRPIWVLYTCTCGW